MTKNEKFEVDLLKLDKVDNAEKPAEFQDSSQAHDLLLDSTENASNSAQSEVDLSIFDKAEADGVFDEFDEVNSGLVDNDPLAPQTPETLKTYTTPETIAPTTTQAMIDESRSKKYAEIFKNTKAYIPTTDGTMGTFNSAAASFAAENPGFYEGLEESAFNTLHGATLEEVRHIAVTIRSLPKLPFSIVYLAKACNMSKHVVSEVVKFFAKHGVVRKPGNAPFRATPALYAYVLQIETQPIKVYSDDLTRLTLKKDFYMDECKMLSRALKTAQSKLRHLTEALEARTIHIDYLKQTNIEHAKEIDILKAKLEVYTGLKG